MKSFFILQSLILAAVAVPNEFDRRAVTSCNADNCLRGVFGTKASVGSAQATADCKSFLRVTASPCTVTSTTTTTTSVVLSTVTSTSTFTSTSTSTITSSPTVLTTTTVTSTVSETPTTSTTVSTTTTLTDVISSTVTTIPAMKAKRAVTSCPSYTTPSVLPAYASTSCAGNTSRYISACSCSGIVASTTTLSAVTTTVTETSTFPLTTTTTVSTTVPATTTTTTTSEVTSTVIETKSTTDFSTFTTTFTSTISTTQTVTSTTSVAPIYNGAACNDVTSNFAGAGGCSAGCYCDQREQGRPGVGTCDSSTTCGATCKSDIDCPSDKACVAGAAIMRFCGGPVCLSINGCTSTLSKKRSAFEASVDPASFLATSDVAIPGQILRNPRPAGL